MAPTSGVQEEWAAREPPLPGAYFHSPAKHQPCGNAHGARFGMDFMARTCEDDADSDILSILFIDV